MAWSVWSTLGVVESGKIEMVEAVRIDTTDGSIGGRWPNGIERHLPPGTWHHKEKHAEEAARDAIDDRIRLHERIIERLRELEPRFINDLPPDVNFPRPPEWTPKSERADA